MRKTHLLIVATVASVLALGCERPQTTTQDPSREVAKAPPPGSVSGGKIAAEAAAATAKSEGMHHEEGGSTKPLRVLENGSELYGHELTDGVAVTALADIVKAPATFAGKVVRTEGEVTQVCKAMGCWMEIRSDEKSPEIHVGMAGHSFFLPPEVAGRHATVEGSVKVKELTEEERKHLESEGSKAAGTVSIDATTVLVAKAEAAKPSAGKAEAKTN